MCNYVIPTLVIEIPISYRKSYWRKSKLTGNEKKAQQERKEKLKAKREQREAEERRRLFGRLFVAQGEARGDCRALAVAIALKVPLAGPTHLRGTSKSTLIHDDATQC